MTPKTTTTNEAQSINASGAYREIIDASLEQVAESEIRSHSEIDYETAMTLRTRHATVYDLRAVSEAEALVTACQYALRGRYADSAATTAAIRRVQYAAAAFDRGVRASTHRETSRGVDCGDGVATDGGVPRDGESRDGDGGVRPVPADVGEPDDDLIDASTIDVDVNDGVRPSTDVVAFAESESCVGALVTGRYAESDRVRISLYAHALAEASVPDGWRIAYVSSTTGARPETTAERFDTQIVLRRDE